MNDLTAQISDKSEDSSQQARISAPATVNIDANHGDNAKNPTHAPPVHSESTNQATLRLGSPGNDDLNAMTSEEKADAKKLAHAPPVYLESDQATPRQLGNPDNYDFHSMTAEEKADAKKLAHAPPVYLEPDQATPRQLGNPDNYDFHSMTAEEKADAKKLAHAPPVYLESDQAAPRLGNPGNDDFHPMAHGEEADVQTNLPHLPPDPRKSDRAIPGAFRVGDQENDDSNIIASVEEVRDHGLTTDAFQVSARLVLEDAEDYRRESTTEANIAVAVVVEAGGGNRKRLMYILIGALVNGVVVASVLATRSPQPGATVAQAPALGSTSGPTLDPQ